MLAPGFTLALQADREDLEIRPIDLVKKKLLILWKFDPVDLLNH